MKSASHIELWLDVDLLGGRTTASATLSPSVVLYHSNVTYSQISPPLIQPAIWIRIDNAGKILSIEFVRGWGVAAMVGANPIAPRI